MTQITIPVTSEQLLAMIHEEEEIHFLFDENKVKTHKKKVYDTVTCIDGYDSFAI